MNNRLLKPIVKLEYIFFRKHYIISEILGANLAYYYEGISCELWYSNFIKTVTYALQHKKYLPIYRMGDGEYNFLLGKDSLDLTDYAKLNKKEKIRKFVRKISKTTVHKSGVLKDGIEKYSKEEIQKNHKKYVDDLTFISKKGILACGLDNGDLYGRYSPRVIEFFDKNKIELHKDNYVHVYHIYAFFSSPIGLQIMKNKNILIINSQLNERKNKYLKALEKKEIKNIYFYEISAQKSMLEVIDKNKIPKDLDLILIGAGIGAANIIRQLEFTNIPCIDVGAVLTNYLDPSRKNERPFMTTDDEFDIKKITFLSSIQKNKITSNL